MSNPSGIQRPFTFGQPKIRRHFRTFVFVTGAIAFVAFIIEAVRFTFN